MAHTDADKPSGAQQRIEAIEGATIRDVIQGVVSGQVSGDVHIGDKIYTRSSLEELNDYLTQAVAAYEARMYQTLRRQPPPDHPYKSLYAFDLQDAHIFFGRASATKELYEKVLGNRLTVIHGRSGAGKTSLLNAGLSYRLIEEGRLPVYVRTRAYEENPTRAVKLAIAPPSVGPWPELLSSLSLHEFLGLAFTHLRQTQELVVIFDQFEEFLVSLSDPGLRLPFINALWDCCEDQALQVRFVISLRRENLWDLDEFQTVIPDILENRYGLPPMTQDEAKEAITGPISQLERDVSVEPALLETLIEDLGREDVELTHLQIVCTKLYDSLPKGQKVITVDLYQSLGKTETILAIHLNEVLEEKMRPQLRATARNILKALVSSTATNRILNLPALQRQVPQDPVFLQGVLEQLVDERLVHREDASGVEEYELAHAYLAARISHWISPDEQKVKEAQDLLRRELASWRVHETLVSAERLNILGAQVEHLYLDSEAQALLLNSTLALGYGISFWMERVEDKEWAADQVAKQLIENRRLRRKIARDLKSNLDRSELYPLLTVLRKSIESAKGAKRRNVARALWSFGSWLSLDERLRVVGVLGPVWAAKGFALALVLFLLFQGGAWAWPYLSRQWAIPGRWVTIPEGSFIMGVDEAEARFAQAICLEGILEGSTCPEPEKLLEWSSTRSDAWLPTFAIMDNEVTNAQYKRCVDEGPCKPPSGWTYSRLDANKPVTKVNWYEAMTYCSWLGGRLPTEEEWEKAARGPDGDPFPWGKTWDSSKANLEHSGTGTIESVDTYSETDKRRHYGHDVKNLAGNVQEWTASEFVNFSSVQFENDVLPSNIDDSIDIVLKGGAWGNVRSEGVGSRRGASWASARREEIGFRCVCPPELTCKEPWEMLWIWFGEY